MANQPTNNAATQSVIIDLPVSPLKLRIHKISRPNTDAEYLMLSCTNLQNNKGMAISVSNKMIDSFGYQNLIREGLYNGHIGEAQPIYINADIVEIPNNGKEYGYKDKDGNIVKYNKNARYIVRDFKNVLDADSVKNSESAVLNANTSKVMADVRFQAIMGYAYTAETATVEDRTLYLECLSK